MKIGVFDSGIGGEAVARDLQQHFPHANIITVSDRANLPYGSKTPEQIIHLTNTAIQPLLLGSCDVIIIACNTATTVALPILRERYPTQRFIGIEPMIKTAATLTKHRSIAVCATPATLQSARYLDLKKQFAASVDICEPDCSSWAAMIEDNAVNEQQIRSAVELAIANKADVIVLGCTHYHWIKTLIESIAGDTVIVLEPTDAIARRITQLVADQ
jgi:glutamate racemase